MRSAVGNVSGIAKVCGRRTQSLRFRRVIYSKEIPEAKRIWKVINNSSVRYACISLIVVVKVALGQVFLRVLPFSPVIAPLSSQFAISIKTNGLTL